MKDQDFPLYFSIVPDNGFNISALEFHGYNKPYKFFTGVKNREGFDWKGVYNLSVQSKTFHNNNHNLFIYIEKYFKYHKT